MFIALQKIEGLHIAVVGFLLYGFLGIFMGVIHPTSVPTPPAYSDRYLDSSLSPEERAEDLIRQMTLEEKIGQMALVEKNSIAQIEDVGSYGIGGILSGAGGKPTPNTPGAWRLLVREFDTASRNSRLRIPVLYGVDANHGHGNVPGATIFPHFIGFGASGDAELVERVAEATAEELRSTGISWSYSPTLDMPEDIRWGRTYETFSNDPALVSTLGAAYIRGLQKVDSDKTLPVLATAKHYIGAGGMMWNSSTNKDFYIDQGVTPVDEVKLRTVYLPPFKASVEEGVLSVMVGLNSWGDTKLSAESYLINDILKGELGFKGFTVSDWYGVYEVSHNDFTSAVTAINAGIDMVMLPFDYEVFVRNVATAVRSGNISEDRIDDAVRRILYVKFELGLFDEVDTVSASETFGTETHRKLAREAVSKSLVLLKNNNDLLPIQNDVRTIRVAGSAADNVGRQAGAWTVEWQGIDGNWLPNATSILDGLREVANASVDIMYDAEGVFSTSTPKAALGIAVVGESPYAEGWGDRADLRLSIEDLEAIRNLEETSEKVIVVLVTGRPLIITEALPEWDALVVAWLPGSEGEGVADGLFGKTAFTGTLPLPWPANIAQVPITIQGETANGEPVLFERYFGLRTGVLE